MNAQRSAPLGLTILMLAVAPAVGQQTPRAPDAVQQRTIKVLCTQALRTSLLELAPRFERASGHKVDLSIAPSGKLTARVRAGEPADLVIANAPNIDGLITEGRITASRVDLARAEVGLVIRKGAPRPDVSSPEAVKRALLAAGAVAYSPGG